MADPNQRVDGGAQGNSLRFGDISIDFQRRLVVVAGHETRITPRALALLRLFLAEPGVVHSRSDLLARLWPGRVVEENNLNRTIAMLREALGDDARQLIRTVAKSGYVFVAPPPYAGPAPVEKQQGIDRDAHLQDEPGPAQELAALTPPDSPQSPETAWLSWAGLLLFGLIAFMIFQAGYQASINSGESGVRRRLIVMAPNLDSTEQPEWLGALVKEWIEFHIETDPALQLLRSPAPSMHPAELVFAPDLAVFLSAPRQDNKGKLVLNARLIGTELGAVDIEIGGDRTQLGVLVEAFASRIQARARGRSPDSLPAVMRLPDRVEALRSFGQAAAKLSRHDGAAARPLLEETIAAAPDFGLARFRLLQLDTEWNRFRQAEEQAEALIPWIEALPRRSKPRFEAAVLEAKQAYRDATELYRRSVQAGDLDSVNILGMARALLRQQKIGGALQVLEAHQSCCSQPAERYEWLLVRAEARWYAGQLGGVVSDALEAEALAARQQWPHELARARYLRLIAETNRNGYLSDINAFRAVAKMLAEHGDQVGAARVELAAFALSLTSSQTVDGAKLEAALQRTRGTENPRLQIDTLGMTARAFAVRGDPKRATQLLDQALTIASTQGDRASSRRLQAELAQFDFIAGNIKNAISRLDAVVATGAEGYELRLAASRLSRFYLRLGDLPRAHRAITIAIESPDSDGDEGPSLRAGVDCQLGELELVRGEGRAAEQAFRACQERATPERKPIALLGLAGLAVFRSDAASGIRLATEADRVILSWPKGLLRWSSGLIAADIYLKAGRFADARRWYEELSDDRLTGMPEMLRTEALVGLARTRLAQGDSAAAKSLLARATPMIHADDWFLNWESRLVQAQLENETSAARAVDALVALAAEAGLRHDVAAEIQVLASALDAIGVRPDPHRSEFEQRLNELAARSGFARFAVGR